MKNPPGSSTNQKLTGKPDNKFDRRTGRKVRPEKPDEELNRKTGRAERGKGAKSECTLEQKRLRKETINPARELTTSPDLGQVLVASSRTDGAPGESGWSLASAGT